MRIKLSDHALVDELLDSLRRHEALADRIDAVTVAVTLPAATRTDAAEFELDICLRVWHATHPDMRIERLGR